ncbi:1-acyl-sn-glycerol-3-phosphate acyltransferase [Enhygromyxa salina]|uniref:1-acyl-sn-glycerol-3-phosphate acyltransferase n=1 Tax=Enhygromyxa salina TaxID=215803 RepID=A0A0C2D0J3_9BACT|nr:lysophospholipid acyltransferase family protein [Enhygromyxa salina]KIG15365.1 1-acyl-sn-glycerol-3-phosphate acyltransferase [Enhygromyxa salina]
MANALRNLLAPTRGATLAGWTAVMLAAAESHKLVDRKLRAGAEQDPIFQRYMRAWTAGILRVLSVDLRILGELPPPPTGPRLVVSNHRTAVDIPLLLTHFGGSVLSRADLETWPLLGLAAQKAQTIFVDRESKHSGAAAIRSIRAHLQRGRTICVFPEGTTFAGDEVRPFNAGALAACRGLDVEFVPVGVAYPPGCEYVDDSFLAHAQAFGSRRRTPVAMAVGQPIRLQGRTTAITEQLHASVQALVHQARAGLDAA